MATETLPYTYTSQAEMALLMRSTDVTLNLDDDGDGSAESGAITQVTDEATDMINIHCLKFYDASAMNDNLWVRRNCTILACWLLSQRRGNAAKFDARAKRVQDILERIGKGELYIPRLPYRANMDPSVDNYVVDHRYPAGQIRVQQSQSTGGTFSGQHLDAADPGYFFP